MRRTEPASALLLATLIATLLALSAGLLLLNTRAARAASSESLRFAHARFSAERLMAIGLIELDRGEPISAQGILYSEPAKGSVLRQDTAGLLDINMASVRSLAAFLTALGIEPARAATLADHIADWRDEDDLRRPFGAERADYRAAGAEGPANQPFVIETELGLVLGVDPTLARCLAPYLTTYSGSADVDPEVVSPALGRLLALEPAFRESPPSLGEVIVLTAEAPISEHAILRRRQWVRLTGDPRAPFLIHRALEETAPQSPDTQMCGLA